jgi:aspartate aminotransferase-like enzyme
MSDEAGADHVTEPTTESDALLSRLRLIDDQPLESRAAAFAQLHDELRNRLEGGDSSASHG